MRRLLSDHAREYIERGLVLRVQALQDKEDALISGGV